MGRQIRPNPARPLLHLEPYTVLGVRLRKGDAVIVHDVGPITHPELFERRLHLAYQRIFTELDEVGPHLIFVSETSRREFERVFPNCRPASSRVLYPAIRTDVVSQAQQTVAMIDKPYLLTTGSLGDRKNQVRSIAAFERSGLAERGVSYVLCGPREPGHEAVAAAAARTKGVKLLPYVSDSELAWLYANASGFVLASLLEGFGIPLAEAIDHNVIPLVTADSVLEEVAGDGALCCNATSVAAIAEGMIRLIDLPSAERAERQARLLVAIRRFTPEKFRADWRFALEAMAMN